MQKTKRQTGASTSDVEAAVARDLGITKKEAKQVVRSVLRNVTELLADTGRVQLMDFGTLSKKYRAARPGLNPRTSEVIRIDEMYVASFKPSPSLKERVNRK